jgi:hypothetical protein
MIRNRYETCTLLFLLTFFAWGTVAHAQMVQYIPLKPHEKELVEKSIARAVEFLKSKQLPSGGWRCNDNIKEEEGGIADHNGLFAMGVASVHGMALLAGGVPADDPVIQRTAKLVRKLAPLTDRTYDMAAGIFFLDKLGDPEDRNLIRFLAGQLIISQSHTGGWKYPSRKFRDEKDVDLLFYRLNPRSVEAKPVGTLPLYLHDTVVFRPLFSMSWEREGDANRSDLSNTQFAMLGLWVAGRYGVPIDRSLRLTAVRLSRTQRQNGTWPYDYDGSYHTNATTTAVGMIGMALHQVLPPDEGDKPDTPSKPVFGKPITKPTKPKIAETIPISRDPRILVGMNAIFTAVPYPTGRMHTQEPIPNMYEAWTMERLGVIYGFRTIGGRDWYRSYAERLVATQQGDGSWKATSYHGANSITDTALAILILRKYNVAKELTEKLKDDVAALEEAVAKNLPADAVVPKKIVVEEPTPDPKIVKNDTADKPEDAPEDMPEMPEIPSTEPAAGTVNPNQPPPPQPKPAPPPPPPVDDGGDVMLYFLLILAILPMGIGVYLLVYSFRSSRVAAKAAAMEEADEQEEAEPTTTKGKKGKKAKEKTEAKANGKVDEPSKAEKETKQLQVAKKGGKKKTELILTEISEEVESEESESKQPAKKVKEKAGSKK